MKTKLTLKTATALLALLTLFAQSSTARAQGTAFTYQGDLQIGSAQANGSYDLTFALFNDPVAGAQIGASWTNLNVAVSNGLFTTTVDFGTGVFDGTSYWLALGVRSNSSGAAFVDLTPRQPITPSPYAIHSVTAGSAGSVAAANIVGALTSAQLPAAVVTNGATGLTLAGGFTGDGSGLTNLNLLNISGPQRFPTNAFSGQVNFTNTISGITITNNITLTNCLGVDENYFDSCLIIFRNGSASVETVTLSAAFNNMDATGNTLYLTNVGQLLVWRYTGFDTNFYWRSR